MRIAFITAEKFADLYADDRLAADELRRRGHEVVPQVWTAPPVACDALVMRSPWDWFHHRAAFREYLETLRTSRTPVFNTPAQLAEFADKTYLARLAARGVDVVPTVQLDPTALHEVPALLAARGWSRAVLKPAFTANAVGARLFDATLAVKVVEELTRAAPPAHEPWLLQPFVPSIAEGELSFVFFGGVFSHAARKRPQAGDWRVQSDYGGTSTAWQPGPREIAEATALLAQSCPGTVYARVDAVEWEGRLHVMELEVVEPELFFRLDPAAPGRFSDALLSAIRGSAPSLI